jgi:RND family efflux transporter MFP subunit
VTDETYDGPPPLRQLFVLLGIALAAAAACTYLWVTRERVESAPPTTVVPLVDVLRVELVDVPVEIASQGRLEPQERVEIEAQVAARVTAVGERFEEGALVGAGELLFELERTDLELVLVEARAALAEARANLELEEAQARTALAEWELAGQGEASAIVRREPQLARAAAHVTAADVRVRRAELDLERTRVVAPITGRVLRRDLELGARVAPGRVVGELASSDAFEVRLSIAAGDRHLLADPADESTGTVRLASGGRALAVDARVTRFAADVDPRTQTLPVFATVRARPEAADELVAGLFVDATVTGRSLAGACVLPRSALVSDTSVLVLGADSRAFLRPVEVARRRGAFVVVTSGLATGETVVTTPPPVVADGLRVRVANGEER